MNDGWARFAQAMVRQATEDWRAGVGRPEWSPRGRRSAEAADWLFNVERRAAVTFEDVCALLGVEPGWMRRMIRAKYGENE